MRLLSLCGLALLGFATLAAAQTGVPVRLEVFPPSRTLRAPHRTQQLAVRAHFADGNSRDVTRLTQFASSDDETATIDRNGKVTFHRSGEVAILCRYRLMQTARLTYVAPKLGYVWPDPPAHNFVDRLVFAKLKLLSLAPSDLCSDDVFVRRAYLDLCGVLPTRRQADRFRTARRPDKRARLIDELLDRPEHAEMWAHHWASALDLRLRARHPRQGAAYLHWIRGHVHHGTPLDRMVREMLLGQGAVTDLGPVSLYSSIHDADGLAARTSEALLGLRLQCAHCHPLFTAHWRQADWHGLVAFFAQVKREYVVGQNHQMLEMIVLDPAREWHDPATRKPVAPRFPGGTVAAIRLGQDRRAVLADWLVSRKNPYFARTMANRIWRHLFGKGIAEPVEQTNELPLSANDELLDALARELIVNRYDAKHLIRVIMNSSTYQLSATANDFNKDDQKYFSRAYAPRLQPEVLLDVISRYLEVPYELEGMPLGTRSVHVLDAPPRWIGFGGPGRRSACAWEPNGAAHASALFILNDPALTRLLKHPHNRIGRLLAEKKNDRAIVEDLFLAAFNRLPDDKQRNQMKAHLAKTKDRRQAFEDLAWAIMNTREFLVRP